MCKHFVVNAGRGTMASHAVAEPFEFLESRHETGRCLTGKPVVLLKGRQSTSPRQLRQTIACQLSSSLLPSLRGDHPLSEMEGLPQCPSKRRSHFSGNRRSEKTCRSVRVKGENRHMSRVAPSCLLSPHSLWLRRSCLAASLFT